MTPVVVPAALSDLSARIGGRIDLVQGAGGNVSQKTGDILWIKASGTWLADALVQDIFVPIQLSMARASLAAGHSDLSSSIIGKSSMRPSIETAMHVLLESSIVVHVHSVNTLAWVVRVDGREAVGRRLDGLRWGWVDYVRPGRDLAEAVGRLLAQDSRIQVVLLGNHGLTVAADSVEEAEALVHEVEERLTVAARPVRPPSAAELDGYARVANCRMPAILETHALAIDPLAMAIASNGALYPDHAVFLGSRVPIVAATDVATGSVALQKALMTTPHCAIVADKAVLLGTHCSAATEAMLACCALVAIRLDPAVPVARLAVAEVDALRSWDVEQFRQQIVRK
jgi:rhamnose utilization protein RhaD (predicted bifunctional aldolase and dehydrogenase)